MAPIMPATPWIPNTSQTSSTRSQRLRPLTPQTHAGPQIMPITSAPTGPTKPAAGVTPTRPATAPDTAPKRDAFPFITCSVSIQPSAATAVATIVFTKARPAIPFAAPAEPALNPNQPTQSNDAPTVVSVILWGAKVSLPKPFRLPR